MTNQSVSETPTFVQDLYGDHFSTAVAQAAEIMDRPEYNGRLQKAMDFVLSGAVTLHEDGTATVKSGSRTYEIAPECTCQDSQQRTMYCKHFLAVQLLKRTYERLYQPVNGQRPQERSQASW